MRKALIVIDYQNDFVFGSLGSESAQAITDRLITKIRENAENDVYYTLDLHDEEYCGTIETEKFPPHCIVNTDGCAVVPRIRYILNQVGAKEVHKNTFCHVQWLQTLDHYYDEIEVCGVATDICVLNNALILRSLFPKARIVVDGRCCAGTSQENHEAALSLMRMNCIEVVE